MITRFVKTESSKGVEYFYSVDAFFKFGQPVHNY